MKRIWKIYCIDDREGNFPSNENCYIPFIGSYKEVKEYIRKLYIEWKSVGCIEFMYDCGEFKYKIHSELALSDNYLKMFDDEVLQIKQFIHDNLGKEVEYNSFQDVKKKGILIGFSMEDDNLTDGDLIIGSVNEDLSLLTANEIDPRINHVLISSPMIKKFDFVRIKNILRVL